jgi:hypothetical protein
MRKIGGSCPLYAHQHATSVCFLTQPFPTDTPDGASVGLVRRKAHLLGAGSRGTLV